MKLKSEDVHHPNRRPGDICARDRAENHILDSRVCPKARAVGGKVLVNVSNPLWLLSPVIRRPLLRYVIAL